MNIILNIDTSTETASVSVAKGGTIQAFLTNAIQKDHASFLHNAVKDVLNTASLNIKQIDAVAVTHGPGSYTGLRVGMAAAKGLCYALNKPLITIGTLDVLAIAAINSLRGSSLINPSLFCPMIDARRMEVYTAIFNDKMIELMPACAMILEETSFTQFLQSNQVYFLGSGAIKWSKMNSSVNAHFINELDTVPAISELSIKKLASNDFTDLSYSEPLYVKDFFSP